MPRNKGKGYAFLSAHVDYDGPECLIYPFTRDNCGYGKAYIDGRIQTASRWMCEQHQGPPPTPKHYAAHSCGNGHMGCVHPRHVSWKTPAENGLDAIKHGTSRKGRKEPHRKLTHDQVLEILALKGKKTLKQLGELYGVRDRQISRIFSGHSWRDGMPQMTQGRGIAHNFVSPSLRTDPQ